MQDQEEHAEHLTALAAISVGTGSTAVPVGAGRSGNEDDGCHDRQHHHQAEGRRSKLLGR